jgi:hypothetical protein
MKALVYHGPGKKQLEDMPKPMLRRRPMLSCG